MKPISEKQARQNRIRGYLLQDMTRSDMMLKESISRTTLWRDINSIGRKGKKPFSRPDFVFAVKSASYQAKRRRILDRIFAIEEALERSEIWDSQLEAELTKKERALELIDTNFDDWLFRYGLVKEVPTEQKVKISFPSTKKFKEDKSAEDKAEVSTPSVPTKISLEFSKD